MLNFIIRFSRRMCFVIHTRLVSFITFIREYIRIFFILLFIIKFCRMNLIFEAGKDGDSNGRSRKRPTVMADDYE